MRLHRMPSAPRARQREDRSTLHYSVAGVQTSSDHGDNNGRAGVNPGE